MSTKAWTKKVKLSRPPVCLPSINRKGEMKKKKKKTGMEGFPECPDSWIHPNHVSFNENWKKAKVSPDCTLEVFNLNCCPLGEKTHWGSFQSDLRSKVPGKVKTKSKLSIVFRLIMSRKTVKFYKSIKFRLSSFQWKHSTLCYEATVTENRRHQQ